MVEPGAYGVADKAIFSYNVISTISKCDQLRKYISRTIESFKRAIVQQVRNSSMEIPDAYMAQFEVSLY
jgi:ribosomal protein L17